MRLRYLHLPRCGPLTETSVVFDQEDLITKTLALPRKGALNFVVGVNGTGKSSLLRALYLIFRSLHRREWPALPMTLAWDRRIGGVTTTIVLHSPQHDHSPPFFASLQQVSPGTQRLDWEQMTAALISKESHPLIHTPAIVTGSEAIKDQRLFAYLPKRIMAYTSGSDDMWLQLDHPSMQAEKDDDEAILTENERPQGWTMEREWDNEQHHRLSEVFSRELLSTIGSESLRIGDSFVGEPSRVAMERLAQALEPLKHLWKKVSSNRSLLSESPLSPVFRISPRHLRLAGLLLAILQAAQEMDGHRTESQRQHLRNRFLQHAAKDDQQKDSRRVFNEIDWFWPTHLSLTYFDDPDRATARRRQELLCLAALADEVVVQPRGRHRLIFSLGPSEHISLSDKLNDAFPDGLQDQFFEVVVNRVDQTRTGAEAFLRVFSDEEHIDASPLTVFSRLREWEHTGLLEDITLTVKRLHQTQAGDGEPDDIIVTYDQLSDGEQMLLGRIGLLSLLRGQDGSLLLLDEPETHFNDVWKREIVGMVDEALLNSTNAHVILSTHTSIVLTDAFAAEVTVLDKKPEGITARSVTGGLFGTDPGEVSMNLFRADSNIGSRSLELLERLLSSDWTGREKELEKILDLLGSSFHRAELRAILKKLRAPTDAPSPR